MTKRRFACWAKVVVAGAILGIGVSACSHRTLITSEPEGAVIHVNNIYIGPTPCYYKSRSGTPETYYVRVEKPGYQTIKSAPIDRNYRADLSLALLVLAIVPYFFSARLEDEYHFPLIPEGGFVPESKEAGGSEEGAGPAPAEKKDASGESAGIGASAPGRSPPARSSA
jgi:hypothetical protein